MSFVAHLTLPKINASAEQHCYQNPADIRTMILNYWLADINTYKKGYQNSKRILSNNTGIKKWLKNIIRFCHLPFFRYRHDLESHKNYITAVSELIDLFEARQKWLLSDEFINNITGSCPICLESMLGQPIIIPDCLHPVCSGCFVELCRGYATYQCPMRCHIIKYVYPITIHCSR
jgi:hypothetical protein